MLHDLEHQHHYSKILVLGEQFNRNTTSGIQRQILGAVEMGCHHIILDFSEVEEIDSTGLGELFLWYHNMRAHHVQISIVKAQPYIRTRLDWAFLSEVVPVYESEKEAEKHAEAFS